MIPVKKSPASSAAATAASRSNNTAFSASTATPARARPLDLPDCIRPDGR